MFIKKIKNLKICSLNRTNIFTRKISNKRFYAKSPEYILPYANQSRINIYIFLSFIFGFSSGFMLYPMVDNIKDYFIGEEDDKDEKHTELTHEERFNSLADITNEDGEKFMTIETFIKSLIGNTDSLPSWIAIPRSSKGEFLVNKNVKQTPFVKLIQLADLNGDNIISKNEYIFFQTLLYSEKRIFQIAFNLFDSSGNGKIDFNEFINVVQSISNSKVDLKENGLSRILFGDRLNKEITYEDFEKFLISMKHELLKLEFTSRDKDGSGYISVEDFSELITNSKHFNSFHVPFFKKQLGLLKTKGYFRPTGRINFTIYEAFRVLSENLEDIESAMLLLQATNHPVNRELFTRSLNQVGKVTIPKNAIELIFAIFDDDGDGNINQEEFLKVFGKKGKNSSKGESEENDD